MYIRPSKEVLDQKDIDQQNIALVNQPTPKGSGVDVARLVQADIEARIEKGAKQYGERLTTHNGRDAMIDLYQELLDSCVYIRQFLYERDGK